ncbi:MAG: tetratricopeptide repeat protein [Blastocatellia bacterium]
MKISQIQPGIDELKVVLEIGFLLCDRGRLEDAARVFQGAAELMPSSEVPWVGLAKVYLQCGHYAEAQAACEEGLTRQPESLYARVHRAEALLFQQQSEEARRELENILTLAPDSAEGRTAASLLDLAEVISRGNPASL